MAIRSHSVLTLNFERRLALPTVQMGPPAVDIGTAMSICFGSSVGPIFDVGGRFGRETVAVLPSERPTLTRPIQRAT
jgi:hypothetical protein